MSLVLSDRIPHGLLNRCPYLAVIEELHMLHPGNAEKHPQAILMTDVEEPSGRSCIDSDQVGPRLSNNCHVLGHLLFRPVLEALGIGCKRSISDPFDKNFFFPLEEKLRADDYAFTHPKIGSGLSPQSPVGRGRGIGFLRRSSLLL